jgi:hypothetical protein
MLYMCITFDLMESVGSRSESSPACTLCAILWLAKDLAPGKLDSVNQSFRLLGTQF